METKDFIIELEKKDMKLWLNEEGGLAFKGPKNFMTDDLLNQIKERKEEIVECLKRERFIKHDEKGKYLQFPLNDMQSAYYSGMKRIYELGGTSCYTYLELEVPQIDVLKLEQAWHQVIAKHDMLRAIVSKDGMQQILEKVLLPRLDVYDEDSLEEVRSDMEKLNFDIEKGPNHILKITKMKQGYIIHFAIDMLIADFVSINIILNDLFKAYKLGFLEINPKEVNFRDIVMDRIEKKEKIKSTTKYLKGKEYWLNKIDKMPDRPLLPIIQSKDENEDASFKRYEFEIAKNIWDNIKLISGRKGLTASNAVLGAFSEIIKKWSSNDEFVLSITLMDRQDKEMNIVGDFTAVDLLTVRKQSGTFLKKIKELQKELLMDLEHLSFSGIEVLRELNRRKKSQTIFPVVYTSTIGTIDNREEYGYLYNEQIQIKHGLSRTPQVWIDCHVIDEGKCLKINWDVREHIFNEHVIRKMLSAFQTLLKEMGTSEKVWEEKNPIKCDGESINIRERKNATDKKYVPHMLYEGFLKQITERSENIAIIHDHQKYSYRDLEGYVGGIQKRLLEMGVGHGDYVAIIMPRSALQIASVLAVSLLGGIFVPLDYEQPIARQKNILRNLNPKVILLNSENKELQGDCVANTIHLLQDNLEKQKIYVNSDNKVSDYAYVIYTSGTTGQPKGVVMSHKAVANTIDDINERFCVNNGSTFLGLSKLAFDLSIYDIFGCFDVGGTLVLPNETKAKNPEHWIELVELYNIQIWNSVPALFKMYLDTMKEENKIPNKSINKVFLSGDVIERNIPVLAKSFLKDYKMISLGGATEAAIWSIFYDITNYEGIEAIPYGQPLANQKFYVLDKELEQCPDYVVGEIVIAGEGLAEKYLNDDSLTKKKFLDVISLKERVYRTGDMGYYSDEGILHINGRIDNQIKVNGHRIETGEVESIINQIPGVKNSAVIPYKNDGKVMGLVAYVEKGGENINSTTEVDDSFGDNLLKKAKKCYEHIDLADFNNWKKYSELTALADILNCFNKAGLFLDKNLGHTLLEIHEAIAETDKYKRSVTRMIHALSREGFLHKEADIYYLTRNADILLERKKLWEQFEYYESIIKYSRKYFEYQKKAGNSILEQLREEINALNLFFPEGGTDVALSAYKDNLINEALNKVISFLVNESIQLKKKVKILEVGAGVGGTTIPVITNLVHHDITYCFTDISKFFLNNARKNFEDYDFMEYKLFDINMNFEEQGFYEDSYDLIICANVLHNSKNIPEVLGKLKDLLKSEGKLLIIEATKESYALLTSLELKGGLDQFTDDRRDNDIIFNSKHSWEEKLKVSGFNVKFILPSDEDTIAENGQTIFFCTKGDNAFNITENYIKTFLKERLPEYMIPRNIRFMEKIPLNVNNKIDRRLLLTMSQSIRETKMTLTNLEEKENLNQNEKIISSIWKEILGIEYVNKKDNFYSVGGDSLLIAQVVTKMRKSIKQLENISWDQLMREVLENPTLEGMSNIISQKEHSIQKMQKTSMSKYIHKYNETENAPVKVISFFHAGTGRLIDYKHMVENLLDKDMSDTQLIGFTYGEYQQYMETPVESLVQDRANLYAETLLEFNVDRYTLVGYCVGGFLALETAKILLENGKKVKLIMIDSRLCQHMISNQLLMEYAYGLSMELDMDNTPYSIKPVMLKKALEKILNGENRNIKNSELTKLSDEYAELGEVFTNLLDMTHEERIKALFNSKKQHNFNGEESTISMLNLLYDIYEHTFNAMMRYRPEGIYSGDITYINATEGIVNFYPDTNVATTWEDMVLGEFKIVNIYANHASIVGAEHSKEILPYIE